MHVFECMQYWILLWATNALEMDKIWEKEEENEKNEEKELEWNPRTSNECHCMQRIQFGCKNSFQLVYLMKWNEKKKPLLFPL